MERKIIAQIPEVLDEQLEKFIQKNGATRSSVTKIALEKYLSEVQK